MTKDQADAILDLAKQLLQEDVSVETRQRIARKIITHARAIKVLCMAEPDIYAYAASIPSAPQQSIYDGVKTVYLNSRQVWPPIQPTPDHS